MGDAGAYYAQQYDAALRRADKYKAEAHLLTRERDEAVATIEQLEATRDGLDRLCEDMVADRDDARRTVERLRGNLNVIANNTSRLTDDKGYEIPGSYMIHPLVREYARRAALSKGDEMIPRPTTLRNETHGIEIDVSPVGPAEGDACTFPTCAFPANPRYNHDHDWSLAEDCGTPGGTGCGRCRYCNTQDEGPPPRPAAPEPLGTCDQWWPDHHAVHAQMIGCARWRPVEDEPHDDTEGLGVDRWGN